MFRILGTRRILFALMLSVMGLGSLDAQQSLTIGSGSIAGTGSTTLDVTMTSTGETEGFVLSIGVDAALLQVSDLGIAGTVTEVVGAWSMVDIFLVGILSALVKLDALATIEPGIGASYFGAVVVLTMFAALSFDPRLIWDNAGEHSH